MPHLQIEDITPDWLSTVLSEKYTGVKVTALEHADIMWGASGKLRVRPSYNKAGIEAGLPDTMIVKGGFGRQPGMVHMYGFEVTSFRNVVPTLDVVSPATYFAGEEPRAKDPIIVMEDLTRSGVSFNSAMRPLSYVQAMHHVEAMARYHASWWGNEELQPGGKLGYLDHIVADSSRKRLDREAEPETWNKYLAMPRAAALPWSVKDPARLFPALKRLWAFNKEGPQTTFHGDCHIGNSYSYPDGRVGFLDWAIKRGPWYKDFAYFLVTAIDIDSRRSWERALLAHYLAVLESLGIKPPKFEKAWFCYRCELIYSLTVWICNGDDKGQFQNEAINTASAVRAAMAVMDHNSINLLAEGAPSA